MKDNFAEQIISSVQQTNTEAVWSQTDLFSTLYRGEPESVIDAASGLFINAYDPTTHMVGEFTFSKGCPGDTAGDNFLTDQPTRPNQTNNVKNGNFRVDCKYAFYTFGQGRYMPEIEHIVNLAEKMGLKPKSIHYATVLTGTANQLFAYFEAALAYAHENLAHYIIEATVSVNSPSLKENAHV
ncbi:Ykof family thiamine-binding protein [Loigolactobacillus binensis]|uniref:Ykof family thiamine-binding protein n=1 Tax=Loigolactobacillus binensis TaxID=2559922 RepID=A0ABW3EE39_9LACO|nr:Ykof family thiamine-binding protein [Loigolactobacillus binensis]